MATAKKRSSPVSRALFWLITLAVLAAPFAWPHPVSGFIALVIGFGLGAAAIIGGAQKLATVRRSAALHGAAVPIARGADEVVTTVRGRVVSPATAKSPTTGDTFALMLCCCDRDNDNMGLTKTKIVHRILGGELRIADDTGEAVVSVERVQLYGRLHRRVAWLGWGLEAIEDPKVRAWLEAEKANLAAPDRDAWSGFTYQEIVLDAEAEATVTGAVGEVEEWRDASSDYRSSVPRVRVHIGGDVAIRGVSMDTMRRDRREAWRLCAIGGLLLAWAAAAIIVAVTPR